MTNIEDVSSILANGHTIEQISEYTYLGQALKLGKDNQYAEITRRIRLAWAGFGKLAWILKNRKILQHMKS